MSEFNFDLPEEKEKESRPSTRLSRVVATVIIKETLGVSVFHAKMLVDNNLPALQNDHTPDNISPFKLGRMLQAYLEEKARFIGASTEDED